METGDKYYGDTVGFVAVSDTEKQAALTTANTALDKKQAALDDAEKARNTDYNLVLANEALATANGTLNAANVTLAGMQVTLDAANVALDTAQRTLDSAISNVTLAQIDTDERYLNLTKAYSDAAQRAATNATTGLRLIRALNNTGIAVTQQNIDDADDTSCPSPIPQLLTLRRHMPTPVMPLVRHS